MAVKNSTKLQSLLNRLKARAKDQRRVDAKLRATEQAIEKIQEKADNG